MNESLVPPNEQESESCSHQTLLPDGTAVGIVALGSSGEAVHLSHHERREILLAARQVLDADASLAAIPLIAGTPASSTRETIELTRQAAECGVDFAMVITPGPSACL